MKFAISETERALHGAHDGFRKAIKLLFLTMVASMAGGDKVEVASERFIRGLHQLKLALRAAEKEIYNVFPEI